MSIEDPVVLEREDGPTTQINVSSTERLLSLVGGSALAVAGLVKRGWVGLGLGLAGSGLLMRSATGFSALYRLLGRNRALVSNTGAVSVPHGQGLRVEDSVVVDRSPNELYQYWRDFTHLPTFMKHIKSVEVYEGNRSHWVVRGPANASIEWDAEIVTDRPNELISWRTVESRLVHHAGTVRFTRVPGGEGTEVNVVFEYVPAGGAVGATAARLFGRAPEQEVPDALRCFKQMMEGTYDENGDCAELTGEVDDVVGEASEESFPASDPPSYY